MATLRQVGETVRLLVSIADLAGTPVDPTTVKVAINDPDGEEAVADTDMTKSETGEYYYDYLIPNATGNFTWNATATGSGGRVTIGKKTFPVEAAL